MGCRISVEERTPVLGRGTGESKAGLTLPTAPQIMRLKHQESKLCCGPGAKCFVKCSLPVLRELHKVSFIHKCLMDPVCATAPTSRAVFVGNVRKSV